MSAYDTYARVIDYLFNRHGISLDYDFESDSYKTHLLPQRIAERVIDGIKNTLSKEIDEKYFTIYKITPKSGNLNYVILKFKFYM